MFIYRNPQMTVWIVTFFEISTYTCDTANNANAILYICAINSNDKMLEVDYMRWLLRYLSPSNCCAS
jgi:hypothetical protein